MVEKVKQLNKIEYNCIESYSEFYPIQTDTA